MRYFQLFLLLMTTMKCGFAQVISPAAFNKMITQDISYAIFGDINASNGIKIDISKPEGTISANFKIKRTDKVLAGFDFTGGVTDRNFAIFKGNNSFNAAFELRPVIHYIPAWNKVEFNGSRDIVVAKNAKAQEYINNQRDTFYMISLLYNYHLQNFPQLQVSLPIVPGIAGYPTIPQKAILINFIEHLFNQVGNPLLVPANPVPVLLGVATVATALAPPAVGINPATYNDDVVNAFQKYQKIYENRDNSFNEMEMKNAENIWTKKKYKWFTVSPFARAEKVNQFYTKYGDQDSAYFKSDFNFLFGVSAFFNSYRVIPDKVAHYFKLGINISKSNNLTGLSSFQYETRDSFFLYNKSITTKLKSGQAYNHSDIKAAFSGELIMEYYILPLNTFVPGAYFSTNMKISNLNKLPNVVNRSNDRLMIGLEGGLIFNINSRDKGNERSILSLSTYVRFEDITDQMRTSVSDGKEEKMDDYLKRNLSFGLKVGIPIFLPQRRS